MDRGRDQRARCARGALLGWRAARRHPPRGDECDLHRLRPAGRARGTGARPLRPSTRTLGGPPARHRLRHRPGHRRRLPDRTRRDPSDHARHRRGPRDRRWRPPAPGHRRRPLPEVPGVRGLHGGVRGDLDRREPARGGPHDELRSLRADRHPHGHPLADHRRGGRPRDPATGTVSPRPPGGVPSSRPAPARPPWCARPG